MELGNPRFHTAIKKIESLFPYGNPHMETGLGTSLNGKGASLFRGWKKIGEEI
jgi:hypothetical protein